MSKKNYKTQMVQLNRGTVESKAVNSLDMEYAVSTATKRTALDDETSNNLVLACHFSEIFVMQRSQTYFFIAYSTKLPLTHTT
jgi:hypothetical protein